MSAETPSTPPPMDGEIAIPSVDISWACLNPNCESEWKSNKIVSNPTCPACGHSGEHLRRIAQSQLEKWLAAADAAGYQRQCDETWNEVLTNVWEYCERRRNEFPDGPRFTPHEIQKWCLQHKRPVLEKK